MARPESPPGRRLRRACPATGRGDATAGASTTVSCDWLGRGWRRGETFATRWGAARGKDRLHATVEDFDLIAPIARIDPIGCFASAGIMVRQSLAADSDYIFAHATPLEGNKWSGATVTDTKDGRRSARPLPNVPAKWVYPVSIPNEWLRIRRSGNEFTVLRSTDGARWQSLWSIPFDAGESVFAGFTGHGESRPRVGYAMFRDIRLTRPANGRRWSAGESVP